MSQTTTLRVAETVDDVDADVIYLSKWERRRYSKRYRRSVWATFVGMAAVILALAFWADDRDDGQAGQITGQAEQIGELKETVELLVADGQARQALIDSLAQTVEAAKQQGADVPSPEEVAAEVPGAEVSPAGPQGERGSVGPVGPQGPPGRQGEPGEPGTPGAAGVAGAAGATGATGDTGAQGEPGQQGAPGAQGVPGPQGAPGPGPSDAQVLAAVQAFCAMNAGCVGPAGPAGPAGPQGEPGPQGPVGPEGPVGPAGPQGEPGEDGVLLPDLTP
jgi:hypothetical protein